MHIYKVTVLLFFHRALALICVLASIFYTSGEICQISTPNSVQGSQSRCENYREGVLQNGKKMTNPN